MITDRGRRLLVALAYAMFLFVLAEFSARAFWKVRYGRPMLSTAALASTFYPELDRDFSVVGRDDGFLDILMLGGSAIHRKYGTIERELRQQLALRGIHRARIWNLGSSGHTTRDSYFKYHEVGEFPFDLVIVYHGINDLRVNNVPPDMFRSDYSHSTWYGFLNDPVRRSASQWSVLSETLVWLSWKLREKRGRALPHRHIEPAWVQYGSEYQGAAGFRRNLEHIVDIAEDRGTPVLLMSFAHYLAPDYSLEAFGNKRLDYLLFESPAEIWGDPLVVDRGIEIHNAIIADIATTREGVSFVDQERLIPDGRRYFNDICHLTLEGSRLFVANMVHVPAEFLPAGGTAGKESDREP